MIGIARIRLGTALLLAALGLAGCGNDPEAREGVDAIRNIVSGVLAGNPGAAETAPVTEADIARSLAQTDGPLALIGVESREAQALVLQVERNGPYRTFATRDQQTIILRDGLIAGTRGLGGDLMSSDVAGMGRLVRARRAGTTPYTMRFLTPENRTVALQYTCRVAPGDTAPFALGTIRATGRVVTAACSGEDGSFTNSFIVGSGGEVLAARQYLGDITEFLSIQTVRR